MPNTREIQWKRILPEGVAIVVSILLAFWIDAWWDGQVERQDLVEFLSSFREELIESRQDIERTLRLSVDVLRTTDQVFLLLANEEVADVPANFSEVLGKTYKIHNPVLATGAYEDMVNSGNLRLISDRRLSAKINQYIQIVSSVRAVNDILWETYYDLQAPFLVEHAVISNFGWESTEEIEDADGLLSTTPVAPFSIDFKPLKTKRYWNLLYSWKEAYSDQVRQLVVARDYCDEILELLEAELERQTN
jgi:hypothetical protein